MENNLLTLAAIAVSALLTQLAAIAREKRNRDWQIEDRNQHAKAQTEQVIVEIQKNTDISVAAFSEANSVNSKILATNKRIDDVITLLNRRLG